MTWRDWIGTVKQGDCLELMKQMPEGCVDMIITDPPFNVGRDYGLEFDDKKDPDIYWDWMRQVVKEIFRLLVDSSRLYIFHTDTGIFKLRPILELEGFVYGQTLIWYGPNLVGGSRVIKGDWHYMHEPFLLMRKGKRTPMLSISSSNAFSVQIHVRPQTNFKEGRWHAAQKPLKLIKSIIARTPGDLILDPFMGSGTTAVAAKQLGRRFIGFEINPKYVDICKQRLSQEVLKLETPTKN